VLRAPGQGGPGRVELAVEVGPRRRQIDPLTGSRRRDPPAHQQSRQGGLPAGGAHQSFLDLRGRLGARPPGQRHHLFG
jgi:hypothetical protein